MPQTPWFAAALVLVWSMVTGGTATPATDAAPGTCVSAPRSAESVHDLVGAHLSAGGTATPVTERDAAFAMTLPMADPTITQALQATLSAYADCLQQGDFLRALAYSTETSAAAQASSTASSAQLTLDEFLQLAAAPPLLIIPPGLVLTATIQYAGMLSDTAAVAIAEVGLVNEGSTSLSGVPTESVVGFELMDGVWLIDSQVTP